MDFSPVWHTRMGDAVASGVELGVAHGLLPFISPPAYVERAPQTKVNYLDTDWWALFRRLECDLGDPQNDICRDGKLFRKRFRLPSSGLQSKRCAAFFICAARRAHRWRDSRAQSSAVTASKGFFF